MKADVDGIVAEIKASGATRARSILEALDRASLDGLLEMARAASDAKFGKVLKAYIPGKHFPAVSVTGASCELHCKHCDEHYLHGMIPAETPEKLGRVLRDIHGRGGAGALISGGSTRDGVVELGRFHGVLRDVATSTGLQLNVHTGLVDPAKARSLRETGVSTISLDLVGDDATIRDIYRLDKTVTDYQEVLKGLMQAGFTNEQIIPHVCIGLDRGRIVGEYAVLDYLKELDPRLVVFIVIIPPRQQGHGGFSNVSADDVARVVATTRLLYPGAEISLGCMRPGGRIRDEYDVRAFMAGINRIALPTRAVVALAERCGYAIEQVTTCCAIGTAPGRHSS